MRMRSGQTLGFGAMHAGRYAGYAAHSPEYMNRARRHKRLLYHSGLDEVIEYGYLPLKTEGFSYGLLPRIEFDQSKTLNSNVTQQFERVFEDVVVKEIWDSDISNLWSFMHDVYRFWTTILSPDDYMIWRPLDRTDKFFRVHILNMTVGGEEFQPEYRGKDRGHDRWLIAPLEIHLKLLAALPPSVTVYASGALQETT